MRKAGSLVSSAFLAVFGLLALMALGAWQQAGAQAPGASPVTRNYPGASPCNTTLQACITASADGDSVVITASTFVTSATITRAVNLFGSVSAGFTTTLSALPGQRVLFIDGTVGSITRSWAISNLVIQNGSMVASSGGGIRIQPLVGALPLINGVVFGNNYAFVYGGAIANTTGQLLRIANSRFFSNSSAGEGGAIWSGGSVAITNTAFISNHSAAFGGAMRVIADVQITGTIFVSNTAAGDGGALRVDGTLAGVNSTFLRNDSGERGGGVAALSMAKLTNTSFLSNTSTNDGGGLLTSGTATGVNNTFAGNKSGGNGGGAMAASALFTNTQFLGNSARHGGGGLYAAGFVTLAGGQVVSNSAIHTDTAIQGGGVWAGDLWLDGVTLSNNRVEAIAFGAGGGAYAEGSLVSISSTIQANQVVSGNGGGVWAYSSLTLTDTVLSGNDADFGCGAYLSIGNTQIRGGRFERNGPFRCMGGGGLAVSYGAGFISGTLFSENQSQVNGAGLLALSAITLTNVTFANNAAATKHSGGGGAVYSLDALIIERSTFISNSASQGGAVSMSEAIPNKRRIVNSLFARNSASQRGADVDGNLQGSLEVLHNTFVDVDRINPNAAIYITAQVYAHPLVTVTNNIIASHSLGIYGSPTVSGAMPAGNDFFYVTRAVSGSFTTDIFSNKYGDPAFVNPSANDFHLGNGSAAVNSGRFASVADDIDGEQRPLSFFAGYPDSGYDETTLGFPVVSVFAYNDSNRNGSFNPGEPGLAGIAVSMTTIHPWPYILSGLYRVLQSGHTNAGGQISLESSTGVLSHTLTVNVPAGYAASSSNIFTFTSATGAPPYVFQIGFARVLDKKSMLPVILR